MTQRLEKTILVTGGAGYVGSGVLRLLLLQGYKVVCVDNLMFGGHALIDVWSNPNFVFENTDINDAAATEAVMKKHQPFGVVHLAAIVGDPACKKFSELATRTNRDASRRLLDLAIKHGSERFVFASTCSNYGKMEDANQFVKETSPLAPVSLYAELKVEFENHLLSQTGRDDFAPVALRFATVYGVSPRMRFDLTVNEFAREVALQRKLSIFGENFWRPYCHVADFARAIALVLDAPKGKIANQVFNVGDTNENYTKKMIADILTELEPRCDIEYVSRSEDPRDYRVDFGKIKAELDFTISKTVKEGIEDVISCIKQGVVTDPDNARFSNT